MDTQQIINKKAEYWKKKLIDQIVFISCQFTRVKDYKQESL